MDTMNIPQMESIATPPSQCSKPEEETRKGMTASTSDNRSSTGSPPPSCAICLGAFVSKCLPDACMHQFCFNCLLEWSKVKAVCPLCKQPFTSIIHNVKSNYEYDEHVIERPPDPDPFHDYFLPNVPQPRHFQFRTTFTVDPRGELAIQQMLSTHPLTFPMALAHEPPRLLRHSRQPRRHGRRNYVSSSQYRRSIYAQGLWVNSVNDLNAQTRAASPEHFRTNPVSLNRLAPWLNRELNALLENAPTELIMTLIDRILAILPYHHILSRHVLRDIIQPHLGDRTEHFAHEFYNYMRSPYDMVGYDRSCIHTPRVIENVVLDQTTTDEDGVGGGDGNDTTNDSDDTVLLMDFPLGDTGHAPQPHHAHGHAHAPPHPSTGHAPDVIEIHSDTSDAAVDSDVILQTPPPPVIVDLLDTDEDEVDGAGGGGAGGGRVGFGEMRVDGMRPEREEEEVGGGGGGGAMEAVDVEPQPSTSHVHKRRTSYCRHDEYVVDRKTVLPLKIRLKRKRHQQTKHSHRRKRQCCDADGYSSTSSNDASLQMRLKRRRKFHKKKYYLRKHNADSLTSSSTSSKGNNPSSSSDSDNEPLSTMRSKKSSSLSSAAKSTQLPETEAVQDVPSTSHTSSSQTSSHTSSHTSSQTSMSNGHAEHKAAKKNKRGNNRNNMDEVAPGGSLLLVNQCTKRGGVDRSGSGMCLLFGGARGEAAPTGIFEPSSSLCLSPHSTTNSLTSPPSSDLSRYTPDLTGRNHHATTTTTNTNTNSNNYCTGTNSTYLNHFSPDLEAAPSVVQQQQQQQQLRVGGGGGTLTPPLRHPIYQPLPRHHDLPGPSHATPVTNSDYYYTVATRLAAAQVQQAQAQEQQARAEFKAQLKAELKAEPKAEPRDPMWYDRPGVVRCDTDSSYDCDSPP